VWSPCAGNRELTYNTLLISVTQPRRKRHERPRPWRFSLRQAAHARDAFRVIDELDFLKELIAVGAASLGFGLSIKTTSGPSLQRLAPIGAYSL
jgi:hypothetical protein